MIVERSEHGSAADFRSGPALFPWTDEGNVQWYYRLRGPNPKKVPGHPVVWVEAGVGLQVAKKDAQRRTEDFDHPFISKVTEDSSVGRPPAGKTEHRVKGFFRGHRSSVVTGVEMYIKPDRIVSLPPLPRRGRVAV